MTEKIKEFYKKTKSWFTSLPWHWKIILFVPMIALLLILIIPYALASSGAGEGVKDHEKMIDETIDGLKDNIEIEKKEIAERKKYILKNLELADKIDSDTLKRKERILLATSLKELDDLQKEFDL